MIIFEIMPPRRHGTLAVVEYFTRAEIPGKQFFACERYRATLAVEACADNWRRANRRNDPARLTCRLCPLGALHAGEADASMSPLRGSHICARCHRTGLRLIGGHVCVSCYNREREAVIGRNAKGRAPVKIPPLHPRRVWYLAGRSLVCLARQRTADTTELIVAALRDSQERVRFAFHGVPRSMVQLRLF